MISVISGTGIMSCPSNRYLIQNHALQWRHYGRDGVSNHQPHDCLPNRLSRRRSTKHQSSASPAFVRGIHRSPVNSPHKWPVTRKMRPFDDVIMEDEAMAWTHIPHLDYWPFMRPPLTGGFSSQRGSDDGLRWQSKLLVHGLSAGDLRRHDVHNIHVYDRDHEKVLRLYFLPIVPRTAFIQRGLMFFT